MGDETPHTSVATNTSSSLGRTSGFPGGGGGGAGRADNVVPSEWPQPTRFDPSDRSTWPEDGQHVLLWGPGEWGYAEWSTVEFVTPSSGPSWRAQLRNCHDSRYAATGDLWLPLPPTPGGS